MSRPSVRPRWPLLRRFGVDAALLTGTLAFLAVVSLLGLWLMHSR
ncbi:MAG TPA: hypothetical protein VGF84_06990 [Micromonosporaceae bacterium]